MKNATHRFTKHITITGAVVLSALMMGLPAFAQVPNVGGAVNQSAPPPVPAKEKPPAQEAPVITQEQEKPFSLAEGQKIMVKDFRLEGVHEGDRAKLSALLAPYKDKELTMAEITEAANKVTLFYRDKGYLVAKAYVPKQDARDGILLIKIVIGKYGRFSIKNNSLVRTSFLQGVFDKAKQASPEVTRDSLERPMLLTADMPGAKLPTVAVSPGEAPETSDFNVTVDPSKRFNGYVMGDNQGSRYTGKNRAYAGFDLNSPFGIADKFSLGGMTTDANKGLVNGRASYGLPVGYSGLRTEFAASRTTYTLGGVYSDLSATGSADVFEGTVAYPLVKTRSQTIDLSLNLAYKMLKDDISEFHTVNQRGDSIATIAVQRTAYGQLFGKNLYTNMTASVGVGRLTLQDEDSRLLNEAGADTGGTYSKLNLALSGNLSLSEKFSLIGSVRYQNSLSGKNLDPVEQFFISQSAAVKAYTETISGDNGYVATAEVRYSLPTLPPLPQLKHSLGLFADNGYVYAAQGSYTGMATTTILSDVGLGYYINFKQMFGSLQVAQPIGRSAGNTVESSPGTRVLVQVGASF